MSKQRWQPPSANKSAAREPGKVKVDEQVVRKMLKVNPGLRAGRTTAQVKTSLERGEPLVNRAAQAKAEGSWAPPRDTPSQLRDTLRFFLSGKADAFTTKRQDIDAKKKALDDELAGARASLREQIIGFAKLLDRDTVLANETALATAFAEQGGLLRELGLDAKVIAEAVRRDR